MACRILLEQGLILCLLHWQVDSQPLDHRGSSWLVISILSTIFRKSMASQVLQWWRIHLPLQEMWIQSLGQDDLLEEKVATHCSILAWKIPWSAGYSPWGCSCKQGLEGGEEWGLWVQGRTHRAVATALSWEGSWSCQEQRGGNGKDCFALSELLVRSNTDQSFFFFFVAYCYLEFIWLCFFFKKN